jgi:hypothetical protein
MTRKKGADTSAVKGRFYCQGIGDCHLLTFTKSDGGVFRMLIDCGIHLSVKNGKATVDAIVDDLLAVTADTGHVIDVVVGTHEHWDHNSGFLSAAAKFKQFKVGEVWLAWTEDPSDPQAKRLDKFKGTALTALADANRRLNYLTPSEPDGGQQQALEDLAGGLKALLGFNFGLKGERSRSARDGIVALAPDNVRYLEPTADPITPEGLPLRIYVLGPPRDEALLKITESAPEMYGIGSGGWPETFALANALANEADDTGTLVAPFERDLGFPCLSSERREPPNVTDIRDLYLADAKRRIDHDWLGLSADLAMQLDDRTNNTSLVLAFEFIDTKRVLLFAADAQVGNWLSWEKLAWTVDDKPVTGPDLLARTVFYKVGHHGSHNATLKRKGLELMVNADLAAFIPTNKADAVNVKWGQMPFEALLTDLEKRTSGRVIRADDPWVKQASPDHPFQVPTGSIQRVAHDVEPGRGLWVEIDLS